MTFVSTFSVSHRKSPEFEILRHLRGARVLLMHVKGVQWARRAVLVAREIRWRSKRIEISSKFLTISHEIEKYL